MARIKDHESDAVKNLKDRLLEENLSLRKKLTERMPRGQRILMETGTVIMTALLIISFSLTFYAIKEEFSKPAIPAHSSI